MSRAKHFRKLPGLLRRHNHRCHWCGKQIVSVRAIIRNPRCELVRQFADTVIFIDEYGHQRNVRIATVDHVIEQRNGGTNHISNLVASCRKCNGDRSRMEPTTRKRGFCRCGARLSKRRNGSRPDRCNVCRLGYYAIPVLLGIVPGRKVRDHIAECRCAGKGTDQ